MGVSTNSIEQYHHKFKYCPIEGMITATNLNSTSESDTSSKEYTASRYSTFMVNLEDWIEEIVARNDHLNDGGETAINLILDRYSRGIQANVDFYQDVAQNANRSGSRSAKHDTLMADIYRSLLPKDAQASLKMC